ncbi:MAG: hybrid sensor histidine kinase/response regulator, partial [Planctomycetes bacterium]|nr:hybrid sensor histidine kinase/response regulator [Planctomycetota bacterium]
MKDPPYQPRIARRLLVYVVLFSSAITVVVTGVQLFAEYSRDTGLIERQFRGIENSYLPAMSGTLWQLEMEQLQIQLDGIMRLPDMQYVEVRTDREKISSGSPKAGRVIRRTYPINYDNGREVVHLGTMTVVATLDGVIHRLLDRVGLILVGNGVKTFFVSLFILSVFNRLVTGHLTVMADYARGLSAERLDVPLELRRRAGRASGPP